MHKWITFPHREGTCSRQAHADFPEQAIYEREAGRSGFLAPQRIFIINMHRQVGASGKANCVHGPSTSIMCKGSMLCLLGKCPCYCTTMK